MRSNPAAVMGDSKARLHPMGRDPQEMRVILQLLITLDPTPFRKAADVRCEMS